MILAFLLNLMVGAIALDGVSGEQLVARASFDANNVRVGDPMVLTVDFVGTADFASLHPPALSKEVDRKTWKVDDFGAKTETYLNARRLVYMVRPLKAGLLEFPALEFSYAGPAEIGEAIVRTEPIPVHAKAGAQAALAGLDEVQEGMPMPDGILVSLDGGPWGTGGRIGDDERFRWRRACSDPKADAFAKFDFPEARLNEAACAIAEGSWARALRIYSTLEWRIGQTAAVERGIVAALAMKSGNPAAELPVWRQAFRPVLRFAWPGRVAIVLAALAAVALAFWLCGRAIRAFAALAFVLLCLPAPAQSMFDSIDRMIREQQERMNQMMNSMGMGSSSFSVNGQAQKPVEVKASVATSKTDIQVGETFDFVVSLEAPKTATIGQVRLNPSEMFGMVLTGKVEPLADGKSSNPSNVVRRMAVPVRYDVPFKGQVSFTVEGMVTARQGGGGFSFTLSQSFSAATEPIQMEIRPLPSDGQPADYSGAIGSAFAIRQSIDRNRVETNDVVAVTVSVDYSGYVPIGAVPGEVERKAGSPSRIFARRYFVADGSGKVPDQSLVFYDTARREYRRIVASGPALSYWSGDEDEASSVAVNAADAEKTAKALRLRLFPKDRSPVVCTLAVGDGGTGSLTETEHSGEWVRVDDGRHAGWIRKGELDAP